MIPLRPSRKLLLLIFFLAAILAIQASGTAAANEAALVIDYGDGTLTYAVIPFDENSVSGYELLSESGLSLVSIPFGGLGEGICSIESHGCDISDCRRLCQTSRPDSPFWQYFAMTADGTWQAQTRGASSSSVEPGDVEGWSWTGGDPALPAVTFAEVSELAGGSEGPERASSKTYDEAGAVIEETSDKPDLMSYGLAGAVAAMLIGGMVVLRRSRSTQRYDS